MADKTCLPLRRRGRPKGALNKTKTRFNEALLTAAEQAGYQYGEDGLVSYLQYHALNNPVPFFSLLAKVLPLQTGQAGGDVKTVSRIEIVPVKAESPVVEASVNVKDKVVETSAEDGVAGSAEKVDAVCRVKKS